MCTKVISRRDSSSSTVRLAYTSLPSGTSSLESKVLFSFPIELCCPAEDSALRSALAGDGLNGLYGREPSERPKELKTAWF